MSRYGLIQTALWQEFWAIARPAKVDPTRRNVVQQIECVLAGQNCKLLQSGIGQRATKRNLSRWLGENSPPNWIMSIGFAGGLNPRLRVGDCLVADTVLSVAKDESLPLPVEILSRTKKASWIANRGGLITLNRPALDRKAKEQLFERYGASACDMETFAVAQIAQAKSIPWISVRVISDTSHEQIPNWMLTLGRLTQRRQTFGAARLIAAHLHQLPKLAILGLRMKHLQAVLSEVAPKAVTLLV